MPTVCKYLDPSTVSISSQPSSGFTNRRDPRKNPFASACRGISAKRSQLPAIPALQVGDGRGETSMPNTHYHGASNAPDNKQMPPIVELLVAHRWLLSECAALRLPSMVDMFQVNPSLLQQPSSGIDRNSNQGAAFQ